MPLQLCAYIVRDPSVARFARASSPFRGAKKNARKKAACLERYGWACVFLHEGIAHAGGLLHLAFSFFCFGLDLFFCGFGPDFGRARRPSRETRAERFCARFGFRREAEGLS